MSYIRASLGVYSVKRLTAVIILMVCLSGCKDEDSDSRPVVAGDPCSTAGAVAHTAAGTRVTCRSVGDGLRWRY